MVTVRWFGVYGGRVYPLESFEKVHYGTLVGFSTTFIEISGQGGGFVCISTFLIHFI